MAHKPTKTDWASYRCDDYLSSQWSRDGLYDAAAQIWLIESIDGTSLHPDAQFLQVGRPGVDGVGFGYRLGEEGFWAYYPAELQFKHLANTIDEFVVGWAQNSILV
jgi:hypothetical protein